MSAILPAIRSALQPAIRAAISGGYGSSSAWSPLTLFAASEVGVWYDPSDFSTLFQDSAGTTPVTAVGDPVGKILDKSGNGKHATQATAASRPLLSALVNLHTKTEQFGDAIWAKRGTASVTPNDAVAPDGNTTADLISVGAGSVNDIYYSGTMGTIPTTVKLTPSLWVKRVSTSGFLFIRNIDNTSYGYLQVNLASLSDNWELITETHPAVNLVSAYYGAGGAMNGFQLCANSGTISCHVWGADLRFASESTNIPAYQRVNTSTDYDTAGFPHYLKFDGVDDSLATAAIDFTATDAVSVFAGMRKASDAARGTIVELTASAAANNGAFHLAAPNAASATIAWESKGTVLADAVASSGVAAPLTAVLTGTSDISGDTAILRVNGAQADADTGNQGTGNFSNAAMYIGHRGGSSLPLNGRIYSLTVLGRTATALEIAAAESYAAGKSGVVLP